MNTPEDLHTGEQETIANSVRQEEGNAQSISGENINNTALYHPLRPLTYLMEAFGLFSYQTKGRKCNHWKTCISIVYFIVLITLNVYQIYNAKHLGKILPGTQDSLRSTGIEIVSIIPYVQNICLYITSVRCSSPFVHFLLNFNTLGTHAKRHRTIVIAIITVFPIVIIVPLLWSTISNILNPFVQSLDMDALTALPLPSTPSWKTFHHVTTVLVVMHGYYAGNLLLQQNCIVCCFYIIEIRAWNRSLFRSIRKDGSFAGSLEQFRLQFAELAGSIEQANDFLSPFVAITLCITVPATCFVLYLLIQGTLLPLELSGSVAWLATSCLTLCLVFIAGCLLNGNVSTFFVNVNSILVISIKIMKK